MTISLRPYQLDGVRDIRAAFQRTRRVLYVLSTGGGKTQIFSFIAKGVYQNRKRVLILAHRRELLQQISKALKNWGVPHGVLDAQRVGIPKHPVVVGSVFTVARRLRHMPQYDLIIQDEAHHCSGKNTYSKVLNNFPKARQLGVTATAARMSGEALRDSFDELIEGPPIAELISMGHLCAPEVYAPSQPDLSGVHIRGGDYVTSELEGVINKPTLTGNAIEHYRKLADGKLAVAFCVSVQHSKNLAQQFQEAGISAASVDGKMDNYQRDKTLSAFSAGKIRVLASCSLITEGWDCPQAEAGIMLRPTESMPLYLQMVGRLLRPYPGKTKAIIIDHAGLCLRHGLPDAARKWSLDGALERAPSSDTVIPRVSTCPVCFACYRPAPICPRCGNIPEIRSRKVQQVDGELVKVSDAAEYEQSDDLDRQYHILAAVGRNRGYANASEWAFRIVAAKLADKLAKERGLPKGTVNGLKPTELEELRQRTVERDRVMRAMSKEDEPGLI